MRNVTRNIKRMFCICLMVMFCFSMMSVSSFAQEYSVNEVDTTSSEIMNIEPRGTGHASLIYPQDDEFKIQSGYIDTVHYTGTCVSSGVVVLRFTNKNTGDFKSYTFVCNNNYHYNQKMTYSLPAGTYTVECLVNTTGGLLNLNISFA